ncbi:MAG: M1 family aminopeptidase [Pseudomonadota bacterium]
MWQEFFKFDLRYQLRQPLLWVITLPLVIIAFLTASNDSFRIGGSIGNIHMNAPVVIANQLSVLSIIAMFLVAVFIAGAVLRDTEVGIADLLFATPMRKIDYLLGRFLAGFATCVAVFALIVAAMMLGSSMSFIDPDRVGPFAFHAYVWSVLVFVLPNLLFVAALLMLLAATTRSMILVYVGILAFMVLWSMAGILTSGSTNEPLAVMLDPFGVRALAMATRYYSASDSNSHVPELGGLLLANRVLWTVLALAAFGATVVLFKPQRAGTGRRWFGKAPVAPQEATAPKTILRRIAPRFETSTAWIQFWHVLRFDALGVLKSFPFLVMLLLALANFIANVSIGGARFDSIPYPLTRLMLVDLNGSINQVLVIILIFFSGELIFRERQAKIADVVDAMPVPNWVPLAAKCGALVAVIFTYLFAGVLVSIAIQLVKGGAPIEGLLYLKGTLIGSVYFILMALAVLAIQVMSNNKFIGYALAIALFASDPLLTGLDLNHRLYNYASLPATVYSDLNGYGHFLTGWSWFALYWGLFALALLLVAKAFWVRGVSHGWRSRLALARPQLGAGLVLTLCAWAGTGAWIFYNTNVLNRYEANDVALDREANYEKLFRQYLGLPHPGIIAVRADVDIFPAQRAVDIKGHYTLLNKTAAPLDTLRVQEDAGVETQLVNLPAHTVALDDKRHGFKIIKLAKPLAAGASMPFDFIIHVRNPGFTNSGAFDTINHNGTLFTIENFFPRFGYNQSAEISDRNERKKRGLGEPHIMPKLEDEAAKVNNFWKLWGFEADFIDFETTVSTSADQTAVAPGYLEKSWEKDGRRYFHYKMDKQILPFFSFQSGRWDVRKADWHGVPIEVYYDHKHPWNVDSMVKGTQDALDYYTENFGPYPHRQVRILEFPLSQNYARSFPNTIPFSESLGFINDLRDRNAVDHVFYVTAHEVAHQWWGDQAIAANVQGSGMVSESLAEYSALMAVEKRFGREKTSHILREDMRLYLGGRGRELSEERPLVRTEDQTYIHYRKGSLVFYRLREEIGEMALNRALKRFLDENRYKTTPYVTSMDVLRYIRAETPADKQELLTDLFERIVFYDNRMMDAHAERRADGQWDVTMKVKLAKTEADGKGKEKDRAYDEPVDIAVFGLSGQELYRDKVRLPAGESTFTITVKGKPVEVGVDPYNLLIDRNSADNRKAVTAG